MIDILYLAYNRLRFTQASMEALLANTDWSRVRKLVIYDDGSTDGTREYLEAVRCPAPCKREFTRLGGPVAVTNHYLQNGAAELFAKVDNDTMLPPGWLGECLRVMEAKPELDLLGIEAFNRVEAGEVKRTYNAARWIGGIGLMRRACFKRLPKPDGRFGFTQWQREQKTVVKGWITPSLPVFLLDKMPMDPWAALSREYIAKKWQRRWPPYTEGDAVLWGWWRQ